VKLDPFYPVLPDAAWVERAVRGGARLVQLRMKNFPEDRMRAEIARARDCCAAHGATLVLNDFWQLALEEGVSDIHLGQGDLDGADLLALRRNGLRYGISTHDHAELDRALAAKPDYVALGPVYPTTLKVMPWSPQGLDRVTEWKRLIGALPLVAIGGLTLPRAADVIEAGADVVAVVTDLVTAPDPDARIAEWVAATRPWAE
jgi:thiamine-phosphate pyrophosphorylase